MSLVLVASERFADHETPPGHPERSERAAVMMLVADSWRERGGDVIEPREATSGELARIHDTGYLGGLAGLAGRARLLDADTYTSPQSHDVALLAAGAAMEAVERALEGRRALALVRPPGHHAERGRAMGFCLLNNVAVAAAHARAAGVGRVAIVDVDVHHGNGTQHAFESDPDVLFISLHQFPFYPGSGDASEIGRGGGAGFTVNLPMAAGAADDDYRIAFSEVVVPILRQFEPELLLVSLGFDAHERDPLGGLQLTTAAFAAMAQDLCVVADECCGGRLAAVVEGGYDEQALSQGLHAVVHTLAEEPSGRSRGLWPTAGSAAPARGTAAVSAARNALSGFWRI